MDILTSLNKAKRLGVDIGKRVLFTSFDSDQLTPLIGEEARDKADMFDFVHTYCRDDLANILQAFTDVRSHQHALPIVKDIYQEGLLVQYIPNDMVLDDALLEENLVSTEEVAIHEDNKVTSKDKKADHHKDDLKNVENKEDKQQSEVKKQAEGVPIEIIKQHPASQSIFVPFRIQDTSIDERFYYLYYEALIRLSKTEDIKPSTVTRHYFNVTNSEYVTPNMLRLHLASDLPLHTDNPGFAYHFILTTLSKKGNTEASDLSGLSLRKTPIYLWQQLESKVQQLPFGKQLIDTVQKQGSIIAFEVLKRLPEAQREKLEKKAAGLDEGRYYTLRQVYKPHLSEEDNARIGEVDIYIHEGSPGSEWAKALKAGDIIYTDNDYEETIKNMTIGQPLFICDETSMPAVAAMLERWDIDTVPVVISITNENADFAYFNEIKLPDALANKLHIQHINAKHTDNLAQTVIDKIKQKGVKIDCAWGAIGKADFKPIKAYLREEHGLKGKINRIRAYWH